MRKQITFIVALLISFGLTYWWYSADSKSGTAAHTLAQLTNNAENQSLRLRVNPKPDFLKMCEQFGKMKREELQHWLHQPDREANEVSFALHYLGNRYLAADSFEVGLRYLQASAEQYLNPFSYLKLGQIYSTPTADVQLKFPKEQIRFEQDLAKAVLYIRLSHGLAEVSMHKQGDNYVFNFVNKYVDGAMENWKTQQKTLNFNLDAEIERIAKSVEEAQRKYEKMYVTLPS